MSSFVQALAGASEQGDSDRYRYFGCVVGVITNANDDAGLCRVKARLRGMPDGSETDWLSPLFPGGIEGEPLKDENVFVFFEDGNENKGAYLWFPSSRTNGRPNEAMVLGFAFAAMYNEMAAKLNQLLVHFFAHGHTESGAVTGAPAMAGTGAPLSPATIGAIGKIQKADGSVVAAAATVLETGSNTKALSGRTRVGI